MNYYINNEEVSKYEFEDTLLDVIAENCEDDFDTMLDEVHGEIELVGITYNTSYVLREVDPIAYKLAFDEYVNFTFEEMMYELEREEEMILNKTTFRMS